MLSAQHPHATDQLASSRHKLDRINLHVAAGLVSQGSKL